MKKQYQIPSADILKMCPLSPLAVDQSINGEWGPGGGEAGAKGTTIDILIDDEEEDETETNGFWDSSFKPVDKKNSSFKKEL